MDEEYTSLIENKTWDIVPLPKGRQAIGSQWIYKVKQHSDGSVERFKARFVAKGYSQEHGVDYDETFSPVFKLTSLQILLSISAIHDLEIHHMDVKMAFLNGEVDSEIYVEQPQGYELRNGQPGAKLVCKLKKGLYGLKQAARLWNRKIDQYLQANGFRRCEADPCIYIRQASAHPILLCIWVDDIVIIAHKNDIHTVKDTLRQHFKMMDLGQASYLLGMMITYNCMA